MKVGLWTTTAANNNSTPPDGWPEGQAPSTVNDCAREMMAQIKTMVNTLEYVDLASSPSFQTATTFSLGAADTTNFVVGRRIKAFDGGLTLFGTINSVSATQISVRLDSGAFDSSLSSVALAVATPNNPGIPPALYSRKNLIINSCFDLWQRSATFDLANNATTYTADRWKFVLSSGGALHVSRFERSANASAVPTVAQAGILLNSSLLVSCSAVDAAVAAGEYAYLEYDVEGYDFRQLAQKPMNLSFWVNSRQSGIYAVSVANSGNDRSFVQNFTISAIATWTKFSIPIPKSPNAGTWDYSIGAGLRVRFALEAGTTYQGGAGNWTAANLLATSSQVNFLQSAGNTFAITGVQLEEGNFGTTLEYRPYQTELAMAQRYYQTWNGAIIAQAVGGSSAVGCIAFPTVMRIAPTVAWTGVGSMQATNAADSTNTGLSSVATSAAYSSGVVFATSLAASPLVAGNATIIFGTSSNVMQADGEI